MPKNKNMKVIKNELGLQAALTLGIALIVLKYNFLLGMAVIFLSLFIFTAVAVMIGRKMELLEPIEDISSKNSLINKDTIKNIPLPLSVLDKDGKIVWNNEEFLEISESKNIYGKRIDEVVPRFSLDYVDKERGLFNVNQRGRLYEVHYNRAFNEFEEEEIFIFYWIDRTDLSKKINELEEKSICIGLIYIDNYEEVFLLGNNIEEKSYLIDIDKRINGLSNRINGILEKLDEDKYLIFFEKKHLGFLENRKFEILDDIKNVEYGGNFPITISIGVGAKGKDMKETYSHAQNAMDIALGRGGDQAVVKSGDRLDFYGGKSKTMEKRTKVKARVVAHALGKLIDQEEVVFIMGHKSPDLDSFGASIGAYRAVRSRGKSAYIVLKGVNSSIKLMYNSLKAQSKEIMEHIISPEEALHMMGSDNLCIVVDNHKKSQVESPRVLERCSKVIIIDHHRRGAEFIEDPVLTYVEPYASSTCELVTEILSYISDRIDIEKHEAEALLAGIALDTKHFSIKTGVRTFEAGAFLRRFGADTEVVRKLFKGSFSDLKLRAKVVASSRIIEEHIAISRLEEESESSILVAAQSADELLNTEGVDASFVLSKIKNDVHISARSIDDVNVQVIMEELGGGGHMNSAGTRIENSSIEESEKLLEKAIYKYIEEGEL